MDLKRTLILLPLFLQFHTEAQSLYPGQYEEKRVVRDLAEPEAECFDQDRIRLLPGRFRENMQRDSAWMMKEKGITLIQNTSFPEDDRIEIVVGEASGEKAGILLRYPGWSGTPSVAVNGKKVRIDQEKGSYIRLERRWKTGDRIVAEFPMSLRLEATCDNPDKAALLYGPVVLSGQLGTEGMVPPAPFSDPEKYNDYYTYDYHVPENIGTRLVISGSSLDKTLTQTGPLEFRTHDGLLLRPLYDTHHQRYIVYWDIDAE